MAFSVTGGWRQVNLASNDRYFENINVPGNHMNVLRNQKALNIIKGKLQNEHG